MCISDQPWATEVHLRCRAGSFDALRAAPYVLHGNILLESQLAAMVETDPHTAAFAPGLGAHDARAARRWGQTLVE